MKLIPLFVLSLIIMQLSACSHFYAHQDNLNAQIDKWLAANEFAKIENTLKYLSSSHPDYKKIKGRKKEIKNKKMAFINGTIASADKKISEEK